MKVQRFDDYSNTYINMMSEDFINGLFSENIQEAAESTSSWKEIHNKILKDISINFEFIATFGTGVAGFYPVVDNLVKNMNLNVPITPLMIGELTICAMSIIYLEDKKDKLTPKEKESITKEIQSELEEFRMQGTYGVVKKLVKSLQSIKSVFNIVCKHLGRVIYGFSDMFAYTALLIPVMSTISTLITKYKIDLDTLPGLFIGLTVGIGTLISKNFITDFVSKIKDRFNFNKSDEEEIKQDLGIDNTDSLTDLKPTVKTYAELSNIKPINDGIPSLNNED